jgi:nickel transport protein
MRHLLPKSLISTLVGGSLLGAALFTPGVAVALSEDAIVRKLQQVPVFIILNAEGQPLTAAAETGANEEVKVPVVFIDGETAETFLARAQTEDESAQVALVDLGTLYQETILSEGGATPLLYFPIDEELDAATDLQSDFQGVPLFIARQGTEGPYLTINQDGEASLPMFFSRDDLETLLDRYAETNADAVDDISVQVLSLEWLLAAMTENQDPELDAQLEQIRLFPSTEVLDYIRTQQEAAGAAE